MNYLRPTHIIDSVAHIDAQQVVEEYGIGGVLWDLDKCLTGQYDTCISDENKTTLIAFDRLGVKQAFGSNAGEERTPRALSIAEDMNKDLTNDLIVVTSDMLLGMGKPFPFMLNLIGRMMNLEKRRLAYVDDQLTKGILASNVARFCMSVYVAPYGEGENNSAKYFFRYVDELLRKDMDLPVSYDDFPSTLTAVTPILSR